MCALQLLIHSSWWSKKTQNDTLEKSLINAVSVDILQSHLMIRGFMKWPTLGKSLTNVHSVTFQASQLVFWQSTWGAHTLEKSHTSVSSAAAALFQQVIFKSTKNPTPESGKYFTVSWLQSKHLNVMLTFLNIIEN